jgi:hypothetical protein
VDHAGDPQLARAVSAFAHGMVLLELTRRLPADADPQAAWEEGIAAFQARATARDSKLRTTTEPPLTVPHLEAGDPSDTRPCQVTSLLAPDRK